MNAQIAQFDSIVVEETVTGFRVTDGGSGEADVATLAEAKEIVLAYAETSIDGITEARDAALENQLDEYDTTDVKRHQKALDDTNAAIEWANTK